ncbi:hypothetical protein D9M68_722690 [compost metagenome]
MSRSCVPISMVSVMRGQACRKARAASATGQPANIEKQPTVRLPSSPRDTAARSVSALRNPVSNWRAWRHIATPRGVQLVPFAVRSNSRAPTSSSISAMARERPDCVLCSCAAALDRLPSSATVSTISRCRMRSFPRNGVMAQLSRCADYSLSRHAWQRARRIRTALRGALAPDARFAVGAAVRCHRPDRGTIPADFDFSGLPCASVPFAFESILFPAC